MPGIIFVTQRHLLGVYYETALSLIKMQKTGFLNNIRTSLSEKKDINNRQGRRSLAGNHIFFPFSLLGNKKHVFKIFVGQGHPAPPPKSVFPNLSLLSLQLMTWSREGRSKLVLGEGVSVHADIIPKSITLCSVSHNRSLAPQIKRLFILVHSGEELSFGKSQVPSLSF